MTSWLQKSKINPHFPRSNNIGPKQYEFVHIDLSLELKKNYYSKHETRNHSKKHQKEIFKIQSEIKKLKRLSFYLIPSVT